MFRKSDAQISLYEVASILPNALPKNDWSYKYSRYVLPLIDEDKFSHLFAKEGGQPNKPVKTTVSLLIFMGMERLTWRAAEFQFSRRLDWLNATGTPIGKANIDFTTLFKFYQRLEEDETARNLFETITKKFIKICGVTLKKQRTDSFYIHGWLKNLSRYGLFKETMRVFLKELNRKKPKIFNQISDKLSKDYLNIGFDLTEKYKDKVHKRIEEMAKDMYLLKEEFKNHKKINKLKSFRILIKVFNQQCKVIEAEGDLPTIEIREKPEGKKIINSPHNTDAEYVKKGKQQVKGHKGFITESCDKNNKIQFITDINVTNSTKSDTNELEEIQKRLEGSKSKPEEQYGDAGFVNGKTIIESREKEIKLEGPSSGRSQSIEGYQKEDRPLDIGDFEVTIDEGTNELAVGKCPGGETPIEQVISEKSQKINVHYEAEKCRNCSMQKRCPIRMGKGVATLTVEEQSYAGSIRHHKYMGDKNYRKQCGIRAGVEGTVHEITSTHGMRKARHREIGKIKLQMIFAGIACNVKRFIRYGDSYAYLEPQLA